MSLESLEKQLEAIKTEEEKIRERKAELKKKIAKEYFSQFTLKELKKKWNNSKSARYDIMVKNPDMHIVLEKLDSHGGLRYGELEQDVFDSKWDESEWVNLTELYSEYCKLEDITN